MHVVRNRGEIERKNMEVVMFDTAASLASDTYRTVLKYDCAYGVDCSEDAFHFRGKPFQFCNRTIVETTGIRNVPLGDDERVALHKSAKARKPLKCIRFHQHDIVFSA